MSHYAAAKNYPFDRDYRSALSFYLTYVDDPTNTPGSANVFQYIYATSSDASTSFLLWMETPGLTTDEDPVQIVLLHSISQLSIRLGFPITKWYTKAFSATGGVVTGSVSLAKWEPRYINLLQQPVKSPKRSAIDTALDTTPAPLLLDPVTDS